jgi:hypothetical protein
MRQGCNFISPSTVIVILIKEKKKKKGKYINNKNNNNKELTFVMVSAYAVNQYMSEYGVYYIKNAKFNYFR